MHVVVQCCIPTWLVDSKWCSVHPRRERGWSSLDKMLVHEFTSHAGLTMASLLRSLANVMPFIAQRYDICKIGHLPWWLWLRVLRAIFHPRLHRSRSTIRSNIKDSWTLVGTQEDPFATITRERLEMNEAMSLGWLLKISNSVQISVVSPQIHVTSCNLPVQALLWGRAGLE